MGIIANMLGLQSDGDLGEEKIFKELNGFFLTDYYKKILQNVYVPLKNGNFTEVDLIMIHTSYIFVIESKFYQGWIYGSENQKYWTQVFSKQKKYRFYNPIMQNQTHINALSRFLNIDKSKFISYIVFSNICNLKEVPANTENCRLIKRDNLFFEVKKLFKSDIKNFSRIEIDEMYNKLSPLTNTSEEVRKQHIQRLKESYKR